MRLLHKSTETAVSNPSRLAVSILTMTSILLPFNVLLWWWSSYYGEHFPEAVSFLSDDGHCNPSTQGFGVHCFGDFISPLKEAASGGYFVANSAPANLLYEVTTKLIKFDSSQSVRVAVLAYLSLSILALSVPAIWSYRRTRHHVFFSLLCCGPLTYPALTTLDRGNNIAFSVPFLMAFVVRIADGEYRKAIIPLVIASVFKPQFLVLLVLLLLNKQMAQFIRGSVLGMGLHIACILRYEQNPFNGIRKFASQLLTYGSDYVSLDAPVVSNVSIAKSFYVFASRTPGFMRHGLMSFIAFYGSILGAIALLIVMVFLWKNRTQISRTQQITAFFPLVFLFPAITFSPYLVFCLVLVAARLIEASEPPPNYTSEQEPVLLNSLKRGSFLIAVALTLFPLIIPGTSSDGKQITTLNLIPVSWLLVSALSIIPDRSCKFQPS